MDCRGRNRRFARHLSHDRNPATTTNWVLAPLHDSDQTLERPSHRVYNDDPHFSISLGRAYQTKRHTGEI